MEKLKELENRIKELEEQLEEGAVWTASVLGKLTGMYLKHTANLSDELKALSKKDLDELLDEVKKQAGINNETNK